MISHQVFAIFGSHLVLRFLWAFISVGILKGGALVLAAWGLTRFFCRRTPEHAHRIWFLTLLGCAALPVLWLVLPPVRFSPVFPASGSASVIQAAGPLFSQDKLLGLTNTAGGYIALARQGGHDGGHLASSLLVGLWALGTVFFLSRLIAGRVLASRLAAGRRLVAHRARLAARLAEGLSLDEKISIVMSPRCIVPFTRGVLHPVVALPVEAARWSDMRLRSVLLHELAHVKRRDSFFNLAESVVTALLWCVPPAWVASAFLARAREMACDKLVLSQGVPAADYASEILELVRSMKGNMFVPRYEISFGRKSMLRERITSVLAADSHARSTILRPAGKVVLGLFCCLLPLLAITCATSPGAGAGVERLYGSWVNHEYANTYWVYRFDYSPDGSARNFLGKESDTSTQEGRFIIQKKWTDSEGDTWYHVESRWNFGSYNQASANGNKWYDVIRINGRGDTMEIESNQIDFTPEFGAMSNFHYTYYRQ
jgi:beta-lactamase regulating signal transducer with metallopeptidase domain